MLVGYYWYLVNEDQLFGSVSCMPSLHPRTIKRIYRMTFYSVPQKITRIGQYNNHFQSGWGPYVLRELTLKAICVTMSAASAMVLSCFSLAPCPSSMGGRMSLLGMPHTGHTHSREERANFLRCSGGASTEPIAPTPSVGMNPISASKTVRTRRKWFFTHSLLQGGIFGTWGIQWNL